MRNVVWAALAATMLSGSAQAVVTTFTYRLQASDFARTNGSVGNDPVPVTQIDSTFNLTFDPDVSLNTTPLGSTIGLPGTYGKDLNYVYVKGGFVLVGQSVSLVGLAYVPGTFGLYLRDVTTTPQILGLTFTTPGETQYTARTASVSIVPQTAAAAPEPASWAMMIAGFGMVGAAMRRRKVVVTFA